MSRACGIVVMSLIFLRLEIVTISCYNVCMENQFTAILTDEAEEQLLELSFENQCKILEAIRTFEMVGIYYKNINNLGDGLFEIKPKDVRAYFMYDPKRRRIIIVGLICLKKTQKAPKRYIEQARLNIEKYLNSMEVK